MSYIPLSDEETRVIFTKEALSGLRSLDATKQIQVLKKLVSIAEADTSPSVRCVGASGFANVSPRTAADRSGRANRRAEGSSTGYPLTTRYIRAVVVFFI